MTERDSVRMIRSNPGQAGPGRLAIVGAGVIGRHHAKVISELTELAALTALVDIDPYESARTRRPVMLS